jgi:hypothetical protein
MIPRSIQLTAFCALTMLIAGATCRVRAQDAGPGPMSPPESTKFPTPPRPSKPEPPSIPPDEIIRRFAANEDEMVRAILGYTFQKSVRVEELGPDNKPTGQMEINTQETITPEGKLIAKPLKRPPSTLHYLDLERGDSELLAATPLFPLTTAMLPKYEISYGGKQPLDELTTYFFTVKPRNLERAHAYFSGVVWVDTTDLVIVKTMGKWVTELGDVTSSVLPFSVFETYRQEVARKIWFPSYARSDESISVGGVEVPIRMIVRWTGFKPQSAAPESPAAAPKAAQPASEPGKP